MSAIFVLIGFSILVAAGFLIAFIWSVKSGQYEDSYTPSVRILFEDKVPEESDNDEIPEKSDNNNIKEPKTKNTGNGN